MRGILYFGVPHGRLPARRGRPGTGTGFVPLPARLLHRSRIRCPAEPYTPQPGDIMLRLDTPSSGGSRTTWRWPSTRTAPPSCSRAPTAPWPSSRPGRATRSGSRRWTAAPPGEYAAIGRVWIRRRKVPLTPEQSCRLTAFAMAQDGKRFALIRLAAQLTPFRHRGPIRTKYVGKPRAATADLLLLRTGLRSRASPPACSTRSGRGPPPPTPTTSSSAGRTTRSSTTTSTSTASIIRPHAGSRTCRASVRLNPQVNPVSAHASYPASYLPPLTADSGYRSLQRRILGGEYASTHGQTGHGGLRPRRRRSRAAPFRRGPCWSRRWRWASAAPTWRSCPATYGWAPPGRDRLILGHESLGRVLEAPADSGLAPGDLVAGHRPPAGPGALPQLRRRRVGHVPQRPVHRARHQGARRLLLERFRIEPAFAVKVPAQLGHLGVLMEPASVLAKAWEHVERIGGRALWKPKSRPHHGRRPHRPAGGAHGPPARPGGRYRGPGDGGAEAGVGRGTGGAVPQRVGPGPRRRSRRHHRMHRRRLARLRRAAAQPAGVRRLPHRHLVRRPGDHRGRHRHEQGDGAGERRGVRLGERQPPALREGRRRRWPRPTPAGSAASSTAACRWRIGRRRCCAARTT